MSATNDAIEILQGALTLADFLDKEEREQILRRIQQLQNRGKEQRTFIAFVGEKKAGKSSLLKAITGVPLPTAVRECTAAVCMIQLGLDWHHAATLETGEPRFFNPIDDSEQQRVLRLAKRRDQQAAEDAIQKIEESEQRHKDAQQKLRLLHLEVKRNEEALQTHQQNLKMQEDNLPVLWGVLKNFSWLSSKVQQIQHNLDKNQEDIIATENTLEESKVQFQSQAEETKALEALIPLKWKEAKEAARLTKKDVDAAKLQLQKIAQANHEKFHIELNELIDLEQEAAEKVEILTPNASIPANIVLLDTPGFNTDRPQHRRRAWEAIEEMADICILVSDIRQPMPETSLKMLKRIAPFCPFMHLALTKSDLALEEADLLQEDPEQEVLDAKNIAKERVAPYWDGEMNIWVVSAEGDQRNQSQQIFTQFWDSLPKQASVVKTKKLGAAAIGEFVDLLDIHILLAQDELRLFDSKSLDIGDEILDTVQNYAVKVTTYVEELIAVIVKQAKSYLSILEQEWLEEISKIETKSDIKLLLENIQKQMDDTTTTLANKLEDGFELGTQRIALALHSNAELALGTLLPPPDQSLPTQEHRRNLLLLTAAGSAAGIATGLSLSNSLVFPLLIALGTGGITALLISPIAESKTQAKEAIQNGVLQAFGRIEQKSQQLQKQLQQECNRKLQEILQSEYEEKRAHQRQKQTRQIQRIQDIQQTLEKSKIAFLLS